MARINIYGTDYTTGETARLGWFDPATAEEFREGTRWDGHNHIRVCSGGQVGFEVLYRTKRGRWVLNRDFRNEFNGGDTYRFLSDDEARDWLIRSEINDAAVERFFGELEPERGPGRPPVGTQVKVRVPDETLAALDARAEADGITRAALIRRLVEAGLAG